MRNLRQRFGAFVAAGVLAMILGSASPAFADTGTIGGTAKNTCAFVSGLLYKVPPDSGAALVFKSIMIAFDCD